jgi:hypothetical protein
MACVVPVTARKRANRYPPTMMAKIMALMSAVSSNALLMAVPVRLRRTAAVTSTPVQPTPAASVGVNTPA